MNRPVTAMCDNCHKITDITYKETKHPNDIRETYFKCEHCYHHYTAFVTDAKVRKMHKKVDELKALARKGDTNTNYTLLGEELNQLIININQRMSRLKYNLINFGRADL